MRNALIPYVTVIGLQVRFLLGGVVVVEKIFGVPGIGSLMVDAIFARDFQLVQACAVAFLGGHMRQLDGRPCVHIARSSQGAMMISGRGMKSCGRCLADLISVRGWDWHSWHSLQ